MSPMAHDTVQGMGSQAVRSHRLSTLAAGLFDVPADVAVTDVTLDSRAVTPGALFVALRGFNRHGLEFAPQALRQGARAVVYEPPADDTAGSAVRHSFEQLLSQAGDGVFVVAVPQLRTHLGSLADRFFDEPSRHLTVTGITGTNGKTTCAWLLAQALSLCGRPAAYIGTLGVGRPGAITPQEFTTADVISVHRQLDGLRRAGASCVCMEVSSHALDQGRVDGVRFAAAAFTNLTQDHLDYHGSMEAYGAAKARLFEGPLGARVINVDDPFGAQLARRSVDEPADTRQGRLVAVSRAAQPPRALMAGLHVHAREVRCTAAGLGLKVVTSWGDTSLDVPLVGDFNVENVLTVLGVLLSAGIDLAAATAALARCPAPPGRMEMVSAPSRPTAIIDYAHTPDALAKALRAARAHCAGRLSVVFGCGGDRDAGKRPQMGRIAAELADDVTVTDDNPRTEDPARIVADILAGLGTGTAARVEHDRAAAIRGALARAQAGDVVLIAGKGHEDYQIIGRQRRAFSDRDVARASLDASGNAPAGGGAQA